MVNQLQPEQRQQLLITAGALVTPEDNLEDMQRGMEGYVKETEERIRQEHSVGLSIFERQPAREQLRSFLIDPESGVPVTLPEDMRHVLNPDYLDLRKANAAPPLQAEQIRQQEVQQARQQHEQRQTMQQQQAAMQGAQPQQPQPFDESSVYQPYHFWAVVLNDLRDLDWELLTRRFRELVKRYGDQELELPNDNAARLGPDSAGGRAEPQGNAGGGLVQGG